jgi:homogentisate 1,2-dioxygenase
MMDLAYMNGFGNEFESEDNDFRGAIPRNLINPQRCKFDLIAEQLSGSAFTAPRGSNKRSWLYRFRPSVCHEPFAKITGHHLDYASGQIDPNQKRWRPFRCSSDGDFVENLYLLAFSDQACPLAISIFIYMANKSMGQKCFVNSDGDLLIVPQNEPLTIQTEFGLMHVEPNEIAVVQQGMKFSVDLVMGSGSSDGVARGYVLEVRGNHFELPYLGPIGANGLANPRDFQVPVARVDRENASLGHEIVLKFQNELFSARQAGSPFDVAAWFGNYVPFKYNLSKFVAVNSVSVDHPDPSIFTVLTCPGAKPGTALADFVIFPPRWECAQDTFRPPYYHRNCMTEFMGLIKGQYQAKSKEFAPGGASLHQTMMPHGPDKQCFETASSQDTSKPKRVADDTMSFMFETSLTLKLTRWARDDNVDHDYYKCWQGIGKLAV